MPIAKESGLGDFKKVPEGVHIAICDMVVDLGMQRTKWQDEEKVSHKIYIRWQIPSERVEYEVDGKKKEGPMVIGSFFTLSLNRKSALRPILESWRGRAFTADELKGFDVAAVLGVACQLQVIHNVVGDKTYANVRGVMPLPRGMEKPFPEGDLVGFEATSPTSVLDRLPKWLREKITSQVVPSIPTDGTPSSEFDDEIPF
jgi:hypothetical protein